LDHRVGKQAFRLHGASAMFADAIASVVGAFQRMVHLFQQMEQVCGLGFGHCGLQFLPADH